MIASFACHSTLSNRWQHVFRHEFISCIWLRNRFPKSVTFTLHTNVKYIPDFVNNDANCYCGMEKDANLDICEFCSDPVYAQISRSATRGELVDELKALMSTTY